MSRTVRWLIDLGRERLWGNNCWRIKTDLRGVTTERKLINTSFIVNNSQITLTSSTEVSATSRFCTSWNRLTAERSDSIGRIYLRRSYLVIALPPTLAEKSLGNVCRLVHEVSFDQQLCWYAIVKPLRPVGRRLYSCLSVRFATLNRKMQRLAANQSFPIASTYLRQAKLACNTNIGDICAGLPPSSPQPPVPPVSLPVKRQRLAICADCLCRVHHLPQWRRLR